MPMPMTGWEAEDSFSRKQEGRTVLFSPDSPLEQVYSDYVIITSGKACMLQAHNLPDNRKVFTNIITSQIMPLASHCNAASSTFFTNVADIYIQRMTLSGADNWILTADNPQMLITLPGVYRFEIEDTDMLGGDFRLDYYMWNIERINPGFPVTR
ncbi:MAG: hypothetical protein LBS60_08970 [Deltaproteobacteria bacterium]|jgi:hypothetical protein|nr:hypothetical protein [Deltaproteobacteria bacterium]